mgnify:CR=1 FL=1
MKVLHLTNIHASSRTIFDAVKKQNWIYIKHTASPEFLDALIEYDLVIKDRYPFALSDEFFADNLVLSWIPSVLPYAVGRNTIIKSFLAGLPVGGSIFFIKSNNYLVKVVRKFEIEVQPEIDTIEKVYDKIAYKVMELFGKDLGNIIEDQNVKSPGLFQKIVPTTTNEFFENADIASVLVNGYETRLSDLSYKI